MIIDYCEKCKNKIPIPLLTKDDKEEVWRFVQIDLLLSAISYVKKRSDLDLKECKLFVEHLSRNFGECHNCNYTGLKNEHEKCPKCKALNINFKY